jgi:hypothetical protein
MASSAGDSAPFRMPSIVTLRDGAYTLEELEELLKLRANKQGKPPGWGIVHKLMAVPNKTMRRELQVRVANRSWLVGQKAIEGGTPLRRNEELVSGRPDLSPA